MNVRNILVRNTKIKWVTVTVGADMAVELKADLNADRDPASEFVTQGEGDWACMDV